MGRHIARRWVFAACFGCVACHVAISIAQAGPANSIARYLGVGWSEGRHARNNCPHSLHPSKPWSFPLSKLWNNEAAGLFAGNGQGHVPENVMVSPLAPQPHVRTPVAPPSSPSTLTNPRPQELRGRTPRTQKSPQSGDDDDGLTPPKIDFDDEGERSPSDREELDLPPPPPMDDPPYPLETKSHRSIMRNRPTGR